MKAQTPESAFPIMITFAHFLWMLLRHPMCPFPLQKKVIIIVPSSEGNCEE